MDDDFSDGKRKLAPITEASREWYNGLTDIQRSRVDVSIKKIQSSYREFGIKKYPKMHRSKTLGQQAALEVLCTIIALQMEWKKV